MHRISGMMLLSLFFLSACNASPSPGPLSAYEKTFSGNVDDGSD